MALSTPFPISSVKSTGDWQAKRAMKIERIKSVKSAFFIFEFF